MWSSLPHDGGHDGDGGAVTRRDRAGRRQRRRQSSSAVQEGKSAQTHRRPHAREER